MIKTIFTTSTIIKNRYNIFTNWFSSEKNKIAISFSAVIIFLLILYLYSSKNTSVQTQTVNTLTTLLLPIFTTKFYLKSTLKENNFMLGFLDKKLLLKTKQAQAILSSLIVFSLLLVIQSVLTPKGLQSFIIIITEILFLIIVSLLLPILIKQKKYKPESKKNNQLWESNFSNQNLYPVRSIINREILFIWRINKNLIFKYILNTFFFNVVIMLFIINNSKEAFYIWAVFLQFIYLLNFVLNFSTQNNLKLRNSLPCSSFAILKGEYILWSVLFFIHLLIILFSYYFILTEINFVLTLILFLITLFLLAYTLLIRLAYADNVGTRILVFIMMVIPITIPFTIYNCYKKIQC